MKQRAELVKKLGQSAEERMLLTRILEKAETCREKCYVTSTRFLDLREAALAEQILHQTGERRWRFLGGYPEAERRVIVFLPDYLDELDPDSEDIPITAIRCTKNKADALTHRLDVCRAHGRPPFRPYGRMSFCVGMRACARQLRKRSV